MNLFRSADMSYVALTMTNEASHVTVRELGKFGRLHINDLSIVEKGAPHKMLIYYKRRVQDCVAVEKRLQSIHRFMVQYDILLDDREPKELHLVHGDVVDACLTELDPMEQELNSSIAFLRANKEAIERLIERRQVLNAVKGGLISEIMRRSKGGVAAMQGEYFNEQGYSDDESDQVALASGTDVESDSLNIRNVLVGTIPTDQQIVFARMLYRVSRGNAFARFKEIKRGVEARIEGETSSEPRSVFYAVVLGDLITARVKRMCDAFKVFLYAVPESPEEIRSQIERIRIDLGDKRDIEVRTENAIIALLQRWGFSNETDCTPFRDWQYAIQSEREICATLLKAHFYLTMISLEGYVPSLDIPELKRVCKRAVEGTGHPPSAVEIDPSGTIVPESPPTHFPVTKFSATFQGIVDTYGSPRYKEANPGLFTIISFPFLFGVMYGDIGHGIALTIFATLLVYYEAPLLELERKRQLGEIPSMAFGGRYVLLLMGMFAVYCGMIYNDCLSIPTDVWGSTFVNPGTNSTSLAWTGSVYPIGVDPAWAHKSNSLAFSNSMKMKMAVTLGVTQMIFGICLSLTNHLYFKDKLAVYFEFVPRMVFMLSTFGYMIFMILYKWCVDWSVSTVSPPNLIQTMINMFLSPGTVDPTKLLYAGQAGFQTFLLLCAFISVPVMLIAKPYAHKLAHEKKRHAYASAGSLVIQDDDVLGDESSDNKWSGHMDSIDSPVLNAEEEFQSEFSFSDEMIHNSIHTIEFVLGCVSNTASYLRLWALSLAHAQLADVFWSKMIMQYGILSNGFMAFAGFAVWFGATLAVLLAMDVLECFLHALRLHWVEFQNKFFQASGVAFTPFLLSLPPNSYSSTG